MIGDNRSAALYAHVRALEKLQEVKDEAAADYNERKALCKEDGFDTNVVTAILKRRKNGEGQTVAFDELLREYEYAIAEQKEARLEGGQRGIDADIGRHEAAVDLRAQRVTLETNKRGFEGTVTVEPEPLFDDTPAVDRFENEGGTTKGDPF